MEILSNIIFYFFSFIIVLSIIVFVHEFGHYFIAILNKVKVETFSIGFGKEENNLKQLTKELSLENEVVFQRSMAGQKNFVGKNTSIFSS